MRPGFVQLSLHCLNRVLCASLLIAAVSCSGDDVTIETPEELTARAQTIHERVLTADTHKDISGNFAPSDGSEGEDPNVQAGRQVDLPQMREGGLDLVFFIV